MIHHFGFFFESRFVAGGVVLFHGSISFRALMSTNSCQAAPDAALTENIPRLPIGLFFFSNFEAYENALNNSSFLIMI
jgi:hypothetical protein